MSQWINAIGLMSGTSLDAIDVAFIQTDGQDAIRFRESMTFSYTEEQRDILHLALTEAVHWKEGQNMPNAIRIAHHLITDTHSEAVNQFLAIHNMRSDDIQLLGFHGQTILHDPKNGRTEQIGNASILAKNTSIDVVADFRSADIKSGGQGAPLTPLFHAVLVRLENLSLPVAIVNIGGVANVTWIGEKNHIMAFDTGIGNALIDDWVKRHTNMYYDINGMLSKKGKIHENVLEDLLSHPYFFTSPPKSLDRNAFNHVLSSDILKGLSVEDGATSLTEFTVRGIQKASNYFPQHPVSWILCGGGMHNCQLLMRLQQAVEGEVLTAHQLGWSGDLLEAQAFAWLAVRSYLRLPLTLPETTGCKAPTLGGVYFSAP